MNLVNTGPVGYRRQFVTRHDLNYVRHPESYSLPFRLQYRAVSRPLLLGARRVLTVSEFSRGELVRHFGLPAGSVSVIPNAVDDRFVPNATVGASRRFLLAVSSASPHKNFERLVRAFLSIAHRVDVDLHIVGGANHRAFAPVAARESSRVRWLGYLDDADLIRAYQTATAFVFPSLYEGFGIPPLEAQACGCPVLASSASSLPEVLQDSALLVDPSSEQQIADGIVRIVQDADLRQRLRTAGERNVRRFSWQRSALLLDDLITRELGSRSEVAP